MGEHSDIDHTGLTGVGGAVATDTIFDAKGDLVAGTGANTSAKVTVGANDTILMADSAQSTGVKWVASQTPSTQAFSDAAAEGTADTFARGDHKHAMPASPGGGGGALVFLEAHTASSSATLDFTTFISSTYDTYKVIGTDLAPATNGDAFWCRIGTGGGPTYDTAGNYESATVGETNGGTSGAFATSGGSAGIIATSVSNNAGYGFANFEYTLHNLQSTAHRKMAFGTAGWTNSSPAIVFGAGGFQWVTAGTAVTALRFMFSSGNIASGTIRIYGVSKS